MKPNNRIQSPASSVQHPDSDFLRGLNVRESLNANRQHRRERRLAWIVAICFVLGILGVAWLIGGCGNPKYECALIHEPKSGCPKGWNLDVDRFTEQDGSTQNACVAPPDSGLSACTDALYPGESERLGLVPQDSPPAVQPYGKENTTVTP